MNPIIAPNSKNSNELRQIIAQAGAEGVGMAAIEQALLARAQPMPRRTILRRLGDLMAAGTVQCSGNKRAVVYRATPTLQPWPRAALAANVVHEVREPQRNALAATPMQVPLSAQALEIRDHIRQPLAQRPSTAYQSSWVDQYTPNQTAYLSPEQRARLWEQGRTALAGQQPEQPAGTYARQIAGRLLVDLSWASSRLEGNTYTQLDTQNLIEFGQAAVGKDALETQMVLNHKGAIEMLLDNADEIGFNRFTILNLHAILSDNLITDPLASGSAIKRATAQTRGAHKRHQLHATGCAPAARERL
jgi:hypothetical protein